MSRSLFDADDPPSLAARLAPALGSLAQRGVYFGTSSWKYEGWLDSIYKRDRYLTRGKFSRKKFEAECLREYAETFPVVGGDFSFYQFPTPEYWANLFHGLPPTFGFGLRFPKRSPSSAGLGTPATALVGDARTSTSRCPALPSCFHSSA